MGLIHTVHHLALGLVIAATPGVVHAQAFEELMKIGRAQLDSNKADDAAKTFEKALKVNPQSANAHLQLGNALGSIAQKANVLRQGYLAKRVQSEFEKAVQLDGRLVDAREGLMQFYLQAPAIMGGSVGKAREQAAAIVTLSPYRGHFAEANIANHDKDPLGAEKAFRSAFDAFPDSSRALTSLTTLLSNNNRAEEAFAPIDTYLARRPNDRVGLFTLGRAAAVSGKQLDRGEQALRTVLTTPETVDHVRIPRENVHYRLGDIYAKRGDKVKARAAYEEAIRINPKFEQAKKALAGL